MKRYFLIMLFVAVLILSSCAGNSQTLNTVPGPALLEVYTTIYPVYDFTKKIGGDKVVVNSVLPLSASPHAFEPSTRLVADLSKARMIIYNGAGMEPYMDKLASTLQSSGVIIVDSSQGIELLELAEEARHQESSQNNGSHEHEIFDPHIWLSPKNALRQGENILRALQEADPRNKDYYQKNYDDFSNALKELDHEYREVLSGCPKKEIVVTHEAFSYLCRDYGLSQVSLMGLNAEAEPTPGKMRDLVEFIRTHGITHIYFEAMESSKAASAIASETKTQILSLHPLGGILEEDLQSGEDYFSIMKKNLESLKRGLTY